MRNVGYRWVVAALLGCACASGCDVGIGKKVDFGGACTRDDDCASKLCVSETAGSRRGKCTESCAESEECPEGYSCGGVTRRRIAVCTKGSNVPFLDGAEGQGGQGP